MDRRAGLQAEARKTRFLIIGFVIQFALNLLAFVAGAAFHAFAYSLANEALATAKEAQKQAESSVQDVREWFSIDSRNLLDELKEEARNALQEKPDQAFPRTDPRCQTGPLQEAPVLRLQRGPDDDD